MILVITLKGSFKTGFQASIEKRENCNSIRYPNRPNNYEDFLPPDIFNVEQKLDYWKEQYDNAIKAPLANFVGGGAGGVTKAKDELVDATKNWLDLDNSKFKVQWDIFQKNIGNPNFQQHTLVIISTTDNKLRLLPWQEWSLVVANNQNVEIALGVPGHIFKNRANPIPKVRILAVFGDDRFPGDDNKKVNINCHKTYLENLEQAGKAEVKYLDKPTAQELNDWLDVQLGWDIFFYAGHGDSKGLYAIGPNVYVSVNDFGLAFRAAAKKGLKLAVLISCQGLETAEKLVGNANIPHCIVMRGFILDDVACTFAKRFWDYLVFQGIPLSSSVSLARNAIAYADIQNAGITWLPILYENVAVDKLLSWDDLKGPNTICPEPPSIIWLLKKMFLKLACLLVGRCRSIRDPIYVRTIGITLTIVAIIGVIIGAIIFFIPQIPHRSSDPCESINPKIELALEGAKVPSPVTVTGTVDSIPRDFDLWLTSHHQGTGTYTGSIIELTDGKKWEQDINLACGTLEDKMFDLELFLLEPKKSHQLKQLLSEPNGVTIKDKELLKSSFICDKKEIECCDRVLKVECPPDGYNPQQTEKGINAIRSAVNSCNVGGGSRENGIDSFEIAIKELCPIINSGCFVQNPFLAEARDFYSKGMLDDACFSYKQFFLQTTTLDAIKQEVEN